MQSTTPSRLAVLTSGGIDSSILVADLLRRPRAVQPIYIRTGLVWERSELAAVESFLSAIATPELQRLVVLDLPLADLYDGHWSLSGRGAPDARSADEAVYLPGRNALLAVKAAVWCQLHSVPELAMAPLGTSPFEDAGEAFFRDFQMAINRGSPHTVRFIRPFGESTKRQVMELGRGLPLALTFSCIAPVNGLHCGQCNKCAERKAAFREAAFRDETLYADKIM
jgi:7-cyano-7-deazaguanine synthase